MIVEVIYEPKIKFHERFVKKNCKKLFKLFKTHKKLLASKSKYVDYPDLVVVFVGKKTSKQLNFKYRKKNYPTDVLSFKNNQKKQGLGELVLCLPVLKAQAKKQKHSIKLEVITMLTHGFLHLLGYDHEKSLKDEARMMKIQENIIKRLDWE
ncbi:MAG: rRNA maturation RNase YbeY [Oligoflexia bacterium]|nr:rRNA maturation RNase YbeY [Oligoflexia bacterium]